MPQKTRLHQLLAMSLLAAWPDHRTTWGQAHSCTQRHPVSTYATLGLLWMMLRYPFPSPPLCMTSTLQCPPPLLEAPPGPPAFTRFVYPGPVAIELPLDLLLAPQLHEGSAVLHSLTLFGKLPGEGQGGAVRAWPWGSRVHRGLGATWGREGRQGPRASTSQGLLEHPEATYGHPQTKQGQGMGE